MSLVVGLRQAISALHLAKNHPSEGRR